MARVGTEILREELRRRRASGDTSPQEVWVRFPRQLGDVIFTVPFFGALQRHWNAAATEEGAELKWIAVGHIIGAALFSEAKPDFIAESLIEAGGKGKPDPWHLLKLWRTRKPIAVLNLSQSVRLGLAAWMSRVPIRAGDIDNHLAFLYHYPFRYRDLPIHIAQRFEPLLLALTGHRDQRWVKLGPETLRGEGGLDLLKAEGWKGEPFVTLAFGTRGYGKRWFPEEDKWPRLARLLQDRGWTPVWLGGPDERELGGKLAALVPGSLDLTGRTILPQACAIQTVALGNVAVDTGLAHTGAATGRPTVTIMGASPDHLINPIGPMAMTVRASSVDLAPGQSEGLRTYGNSAHRLPPERVVFALEALLREAGVPEAARAD